MARSIRLADRRIGSAATWMVVAAAAAIVPIALLRLLNEPSAGDKLLVYCAASLHKPVEASLKRSGIAFTLNIGASGAMEANAQLTGRGDLFVPAAHRPFMVRAERSGLVARSQPIAQQRLVIGVAWSKGTLVGSIDELIASGVAYGLTNQSAAAGAHAKLALPPDQWRRLASGATATFPTVTELAEAIRSGGRIEAGVIWNTPARQYRLQAIETPELSPATATISVGLLASSDQSALAQQAIDWLASDDQFRARFALPHVALDRAPGGLAP